LGDRVITYLPRCADTNSEVRKISAQILDQFFSISLSLPKAVLTSGLDSEDSYKALSSLEDVIAILKSVSTLWLGSELCPFLLFASCSGCQIYLNWLSGCLY
jgi:hypothetical protein